MKKFWKTSLLFLGLCFAGQKIDAMPVLNEREREDITQALCKLPETSSLPSKEVAQIVHKLFPRWRIDPEKEAEQIDSLFKQQMDEVEKQAREVVRLILEHPEQIVRPLSESINPERDNLLWSIAELWNKRRVLFETYEANRLLKVLQLGPEEIAEFNQQVGHYTGAVESWVFLSAEQRDSLITLWESINPYTQESPEEKVRLDKQRNTAFLCLLSYIPDEEKFLSSYQEDLLKAYNKRLIQGDEPSISSAHLWGEGWEKNRENFAKRT